MEIIKKKMIAFVLIGITIISCNKEEIEPNIDVINERIHGKWIIEGVNEYSSIEFKKDGFSFVRKSEINVDPDFSTLGIYEIVENNIIYIADFGALLVTRLTEDSISFTLEVTRNNAVYNLTAKKITPISNSEQTDLISKSWIIESINGQNSQFGIVMLTNAGTFYSYTQNAIENYGSWKWCNIEETKIAITTNNSNLDCNGIQVIENIVLTPNSFSGIDKRNGTSDVLIMKNN